MCKTTAWQSTGNDINMISLPAIDNIEYRQVSNIRRTKFQQYIRDFTVFFFFFWWPDVILKNWLIIFILVISDNVQ